MIPIPAPEPRDPANEVTATSAGSSASEVSTREVASRTWGPLELRDTLGSGAFGTVFRAWDPRLTKEVALKILHSKSRPDADSALLTEARRLARIRHPHVVTVYGAEVHEGNVGFWMELIHGVTLEEQLEQSGALGPEEAAALGISMTQALAAVHGTGLVHGDIKARNIMREEGGRYILTDFGASRDLGSMSDDTGSNIVGTPLYMAPEVIRGARPSHASDIYSLGVLLFHCVTRGYPVTGATLAAVRSAHERGARQYLRDVRPDLPAPFVHVVERALAVDPAARFATAGAVEEALIGLTRRTGTVSRRRLLGLFAGATAVLLGVVGWLAVFAPGDVPAPAGRLDIRTVAVLPFDTDGASAEESFGRGFTELLTARLSEVASLRVVSQTSARQVRGRSLVLPEAARVLGADAIVEGSIQSDAGRVRVNVRLVHAGTDAVMWSESFESTVGDVLRLQADLALSVGQQLRQALTATEQRRLGSLDTISPEAQDAFLKGSMALASLRLDGTHEAVRHLERAIRIDPAYARAHAMLSDAYWFLGVSLNAMPLAESSARARASAQRALQLDPDLPRAHAAIGQVYFYFDWDWPRADAEFKAAVALNPSDPDAHQQYGWFLAALGRLEEALDHMRRARELDPLSQRRRSPLAAVLYYQGHYAEAIAELDEALVSDPAFLAAHVGRARSLSAQGRTVDALQVLLGPARAEGARYLAELGRVHAQAGDVDKAAEILAALLQQRSASLSSVQPDLLAFLHAALGHTDAALDMIEQAYRERAPALLWIKVDPRYNSLRTHPRFASVLKAMGLL